MSWEFLSPCICIRGGDRERVEGGRHKLIFFLPLFEDYAKSGPVTEGVERKARQRLKREDAAAAVGI